MNKRLFHLAIGGTVLDQSGIAGIENALTAASDWYRLAHGYSWMIYADGGLDWWRNRFREVPALAGTTTSFFLAELNPNNISGYLRDDHWKWIAKYR